MEDALELLTRLNQEIIVDPSTRPNLISLKGSLNICLILNGTRFLIALSEDDLKSNSIDEIITNVHSTLHASNIDYSKIG